MNCDPAQTLALPLAPLRDATWIDRPHPTRLGWVQTINAKTGRVVGNRPELKNKKPKTK